MSAGITGDPSKVPIGREYADKLPYASMFAWFGGSTKALMVLSEIEAGPRWLWVSAERQSIKTFGPFAERVLGLDLELRGTRFEGGWKPNPLSMLGETLQRTLDVSVENKRVQIVTSSQFKLGSKDKIAIAGTEFALQLVYEKVSSEGRHQHDNKYWVETSSGRCWKAKQIAIPTLPELNTEILKYPSET